MAKDDENFSRHPTGGGLGPKADGGRIGGTYKHSVKVDPEAARRGQHTPIPGDVPHDAGEPYAPDN
jgi:hypothetical protein